MSYSENQQGNAIVVKIPRWLNWRLVGLIFSVGVLIFIVSIVSDGKDGSSDGDIYARLKDLSRLSTVEYKLSTVVKVVNPRGIRGDEVLVYGVCGRVVAGIDLSKLEREDVKTNGPNVHITLPQAEIFTLDLILKNDMRYVPPYELGEKDRTVEMRSACEETYSWTVPFPLSRTPELVADAQEEALKAFQETAERNNILAKAHTNAETLLGDLLTTIGFRTIEFEAQQEIELPKELP